MSRKAKFVRNSKFRQHQIQTASLIRHEADQQLRLLARDIAEGKQTAPPPYAINALDATKRAIRAFNIEEMTRETRK